MLWSIYCFCITRSQRRDEKGIWEEMWNNSVQSVLEQKVKRWNILYNCNRIGLETELRLSPALPRELSPRPQGKEFRLQCTRLHAWPTPRLEPLRGKWVTIMCPAPKTSNRLADHGFSASFFRQRLDLQMNITIQAGLTYMTSTWHPQSQIRGHLKWPGNTIWKDKLNESLRKIWKSSRKICLKHVHFHHSALTWSIIIQNCFGKS